MQARERTLKSVGKSMQRRKTKTAQAKNACATGPAPSSENNKWPPELRVRSRGSFRRSFVALYLLDSYIQAGLVHVETLLAVQPFHKFARGFCDCPGEC